MKKLIDSTLLLTGILLLTTAWMACDSVGPKPEVSQGNLSGVVREEGTERPLPDIAVALNSVETMTDQNGRFAFGEVPLGARTLRINATGFDAYTQQVDVQTGNNTFDVSLVRKKYYEFDSDYGNHGLYLTPGVSTYRGVIFLGPPSNRDTRGFASGIPRVSPPPGLNELVAVERERSLLLAEKYGLALMGAEVTGINRNTASSVISALEQFAEESGHPELAQAPLLVMGFSSGGCFAYEFVIHHSERAIGFMTQKGQCHSWQNSAPPRLVPGYFFIGETDMIQRAENITERFEENRAQGALWALAVEPGAGHTPVCDEDLLFNWMDVVLESRLPETVSPGEPVALKALDEASGWLGHRESFATAAYASYTEDKLQASWLPSSQTAQDWQAFVTGANAEECPYSDTGQ